MNECSHPTVTWVPSTDWAMLDGLTDVELAVLNPEAPIEEMARGLVLCRDCYHGFSYLDIDRNVVGDLDLIENQLTLMGLVRRFRPWP